MLKYNTFEVGGEILTGSQYEKKAGLQNQRKYKASIKFADTGKPIGSYLQEKVSSLFTVNHVIMRKSVSALKLQNNPK